MPYIFRLFHYQFSIFVLLHSSFSFFCSPIYLPRSLFFYKFGSSTASKIPNKESRIAPLRRADCSSSSVMYGYDGEYDIPLLLLLLLLLLVLEIDGDDECRLGDGEYEDDVPAAIVL